jgi:hypothetical protein
LGYMEVTVEDYTTSWKRQCQCVRWGGTTHHACRACRDHDTDPINVDINSIFASIPKYYKEHPSSWLT